MGFLELFLMVRSKVDEPVFGQTENIPKEDKNDEYYQNPNMIEFQVLASCVNSDFVQN